MSNASLTFNALPLKLQQKSKLIAGNIPGVSAIDPATLLLIAQFILKIVEWFMSFQDVKESRLTFLQRSRLWFILQVSGASGATYKNVVEAVFANLDWDTFNAVKQGQSV